MHGSNLFAASDTQPYDSIPFLRHGRLLKAVTFDDQAWFCLKDLGRVMGTGLDERQAVKLDADQRRMMWLRYQGELHHTAMVSESGALALLVYHYVPENRALRQWLTQVVLPTLRAAPAGERGPLVGQMSWPRLSLSVLYWQDEPWVRLRDMPQLLPASAGTRRTSWWRRLLERRA